MDVKKFRDIEEKTKPDLVEKFNLEIPKESINKIDLDKPILEDTNRIDLKSQAQENNEQEIISEGAEKTKLTDEEKVKTKDGTDFPDEIKNQPIENKIEGCRREQEVLNDLKNQYPEEEGYTIEQEVYLRDADGKIVKDPVTNEARRIDFMVIKDGKAVDSIEVTSLTADKVKQSEKENRIREADGNYVKDSSGDLIIIPDDVKTKIERRA